MPPNWSQQISEQREHRGVRPLYCRERRLSRAFIAAANDKKRQPHDGRNQAPC